MMVGRALDITRRDLGDGAWIAVLEDFVPGDLVLMEQLRAVLPLGSQTIRLAGREVLSPRLVSWHGDPDAYYRYSGRTFKPNPWTRDLQAVRERVNAAVGATFNSVLVNYYRDGEDSMGEHSDDEPELGPEPDNILIASVSLGARRRFLLRHKRIRANHEFWLGDGNLLVMGGTTQRHYKHRVPRTTAQLGPRMNLTFRVVAPGAARPSVKAAL
jgi:alkylated DNA repair dioxygenase AlkB